MKTSVVALSLLLLALGSLIAGDNVRHAAPNPLSGRGYELLTTKAYLPPDFDQSTFDDLWKTSEEPLRSQERPMRWRLRIPRRMRRL